MKYFIHPDYHNTPVAKAFSDFSKAYQSKGDFITQDRISQLVKVHIAGKNFYVKTYQAGGKNVRRFLGRSRVRAEWENLEYFSLLSIPIPKIVAFGEKRLIQKKGVLITEEIPTTLDLESFVRAYPEKLKDKKWLQTIGEQIATHLRNLHQQRFIHRDLNWRNILVQNDPTARIYFIDCPSGKREKRWRLKRGIIKDLAWLDKKARYSLSKTQRLRFFLCYRLHVRLEREDKKLIKGIMQYSKKFLKRDKRSIAQNQ